ncbi:MAG: DEAD/DEAH box helicase [Promethearchaeota archaeon]
MTIEIVESQEMLAPKIINVDDLDEIDTSVENNIPDPRIASLLLQRGIKSLRKIQALAIRSGLFFRRGLLISSPSGSGKTLIGELAAINSILEGYGKAAYLVPLKALAVEKYKHFVKHYGPQGIKTEISIGDYDMPAEDLKDADIIIMTYEKMDSLIRKVAKNMRDVFGAVIIDEIHVMGEEKRGPRLESLIIRMARVLGDVQLIGLSATIANPKTFNKWLNQLGYNTTLLISAKRPIPLDYKIVVSNNDFKFFKRVFESVTKNSGQVLVFTRTRKRAESLARQFAPMIRLLINKDMHERRIVLAMKLKQVNRFSSLPTLICSGIAYHHAGLSASERDIVEHAFKKGYIKVICCTTTLSAGINMPARFVILHDYKQLSIRKIEISEKNMFQDHPRHGGLAFKPIPRNLYHQIMGRAGRPGFDKHGTGYTIVRSEAEKAWVQDYYFKRSDKFNHDEPRYEPLNSMLRDRHIMLEQLLINIHELGDVDYESLKAFFQQTFYNFLLSDKNMPIDAMLRIRNVTCRDLLGHDFEIAQKLLAGNENPKVTIVDASKERVAGIVEVNNGAKKHECQLTRLGVFRCSCGAGMKKKIALEMACDHLRLVLYEAILKNPDAEPFVNEMLVSSFKEDCYIDYLVDHGFIEHSNKNTYSCTAFGHLVSNLYLLPTTAVLIREKLFDHAKKEFKTDFTQWIFKLFKEIFDQEDRKVDPALFHAAWHWINEEPMEIVLSPGVKRSGIQMKLKPADHDVYPGDFASFKESLSRWTRITRRIAEFFDMNEIGKDLLMMEARVDHGVHEELIEIITNIKGVGRIRGRMLYDAGYRTIEAIQSASAPQMHGRIGLSIPLCERIIKAAKSHVDVVDLE